MRFGVVSRALASSVSCRVGVVCVWWGGAHGVVWLVMMFMLGVSSSKVVWFSSCHFVFYELSVVQWIGAL